MKVGVVAFANIRFCPYIKFYTRHFDECRIPYEVIYWDRHGIKEDPKYIHHVFRCRLNDSASRAVKFYKMLKYARFVNRICEKREYDFLIVLTTLPAVFMSPMLIGRYAKRFVLDIRDYSYEHIPGYRWILKRLMHNSALNVVSSPGLSQVLPHDDVYLCHNIDPEIMTGHLLHQAHLAKTRKTLVIGFVGVIRYADSFKRFVDRIGNDPRFEFRLYGTGVDENVLKRYCSGRGITNVRFFGAYRPEDKESIYKGIDLIFNGYGNRSNQVRLALSNKLYDAAWYGKPILVSEGTIMEEYAKGICYTLRDSDSRLADHLYSWYWSIDWDLFSHRCLEILQTALADNAKVYAELDAVLEKVKYRRWSTVS